MMLGLELRKEFKGRRLKGTAIELTNKNKTGAKQDRLRTLPPSPRRSGFPNVRRSATTVQDLLTN